MAAGKKKTSRKPTAAKPARKTAGQPRTVDAPNQGELGFGAPVRPAKPEAKASAPAPAPIAAAEPAAPPPAAKGERAPSFSPVARRIRSESNIIRQKILLGEKPAMKFPLRSLANVTYSSGTGYFKLKGKHKERTLTVNTVKTFAQTLKMMALSKELVDTDDIATKREAYYVSKNWAEARFKEQPESDTVMEDVEAFFGVNREQLGFVPEEKGGDVAGRLVVIDHDRDTGEELRIDCTRFGSGAYSIPISVEDLRFETDAQFILCIETAGMFQRLVKHNYWKSANCILISMGGVPTRACRRFVRRLADSFGLPVYVFVDGDPYGYSNIYRTLKVGSRQRRPPQRVLLRAPGPPAGHHAPGHHRVRAADPSAEGRGHQAGTRRLEERSLHPALPGLAAGAGADDQDGGARRAAGAGQARAELRDRGVPAAEIGKCGAVLALGGAGLLALGSGISMRRSAV